eukprot:1138863-Pelagomonas_calceolata.AAC.1
MIPRAETLCAPSLRGTNPMGIRRVISSTPCLILLIRVRSRLLKSASVASKLKWSGKENNFVVGGNSLYNN